MSCVRQMLRRTSFLLGHFAGEVNPCRESMIPIIRSVPRECENGFQSLFKAASYNQASVFWDSNCSLKFKPLPKILDNPITSNRHVVKILDIPVISNRHVVDVPYQPFKIINDECVIEEIKEPNQGIPEKHAVVMIVVRRRKMRVHKLKKLRRKMKVIYAKIRQRREALKEKTFQAELMSQIKEAEKFDPVAYAKEKIDKANKIFLPTRWKGKRLPEFVIVEQIAKAKKKRSDYFDSLERRNKVNEEFKDYFDKI